MDSTYVYRPNGRMNVFLDLDNTIINALEEKERQTLNTDFQNQFVHHDLTAYGMRIYARPHLEEFLDFLFANFNVHIFTAAEQEYALFIKNKFIENKPHRRVGFTLFRYHVDLGLERYGGMKDMELLFRNFRYAGFFPCNTVIIDDLDDVYKDNPDHTIRIKAFNVLSKSQANPEAPKDDDLYRVMRVLAGLKDRYEHSTCLSQIYNGRVPLIQSPFDL